MDKNEIISATVVLMVCGLIAGTTAIPLIAGISQETIIEDYNDESLAGWVRMAYGADDFDVSIEADAGTINAGGQTGTVDSIVYADDKLSVYATGDKLTIVNGYATTPAVVEATNVQITNADGAISVVADGDTIVSGDSPAWAYYPDVDGTYGYFDASNEGIKVKDDAIPAYVGNFAGVWAYNGTVVAPNGYGDLGGMELNATVTDGVINSVTWEREAKNVEITSSLPVDTSYWESSTYAGSPAVKYIGPASDLIVVPTTFNGSRINHMNPALTSDNIASDGATVVWGFVASPNAQNLNVNGTAVFGRGMTLSNQAFKDTSLDNVVFSSSFNFISGGVDVFAGSNVGEVLNLGSTEITSSLQSTMGLANATIKDHIDANGYIAPLSFSVTVQKTGAVFEIIGLLPLIMILGVVMVGVYVVANRYA